MLILYQFERTWGNPNLSHFCCKTETYLRMAGIEYGIKTTLPLFAMDAARRSRKGIGRDYDRRASVG